MAIRPSLDLLPELLRMMEMFDYNRRRIFQRAENINQFHGQNNMDTQKDTSQNQSTMLLITGIILAAILAFGALFFLQSSTPPAIQPQVTADIQTVKHIKLVHYLQNGKQEVVEFDCKDILTRMQLSKSSTTLQKETLRVSVQNMQTICQTIGANLSGMKDRYGIEDGERYEYALIVLTQDGSKTIYFNLTSMETPDFLKSVVTILQTATGVPISPIPDQQTSSLGTIPTPSVGSSQSGVNPTATIIPTIAKQNPQPQPTAPPSLCTNVQAQQGARPVIQSNTVCTP